MKSVRFFINSQHDIKIYFVYCRAYGRYGYYSIYTHAIKCTHLKTNAASSAVLSLVCDNQFFQQLNATFT